MYWRYLLSSLGTRVNWSRRLAATCARTSGHVRRLKSASRVLRLARSLGCERAYVRYEGQVGVCSEVGRLVFHQRSEREGVVVVEGVSTWDGEVVDDILLSLEDVFP